MIKGFLLVLLTLIYSINLSAQMDIDPTIEINEEMETLMPDLDNSRLYLPIEEEDHNGYVMRIKYLQKWSGSYSNWIRHFEYDDQGLKTKEWNTDTLGKMIEVVACGAPMTKYRYNDNGNLIEESFYSNDSTPTYHDCHLCQKIIFEYDRKERMTFLQVVSLEGTVLNTLAFTKYQGDKLKELRLLQADRTLKKDIPSIIRIKYDIKGRERERTYYHWDETPVKSADEIYCERYEYEDEWQIISFFNFQGDLIRKVKKTGNAIVTRTEAVQD